MNNDLNLDNCETPDNYEVMLAEARDMCPKLKTISIPILQERFHIGYVTAATMMAQLDEEGMFD